tara:strand:+ start:4210 stop:5841 length:1632 start_codon:yes stop_codon:yes gene_type:complete
MPSQSDTINLINAVLSEHTAYWKQNMAQMKRLRQAYLTKFWEGADTAPEMIQIETADAYSFIESFIAALFSKAPAIEVDSNRVANDEKAIVKEVCNNFLYHQRKALENATRNALIYPMSFLKMAPQESEDPLNRVRVKACVPWDIIVDREADDWDSQRWVGHKYYITMTEARQRYGAKKFHSVRKEDYFNDRQSTDTSIPSSYEFVEVIEFYDMNAGKLYIYSPNYGTGDKLLETSDIPLSTYDGQPLVAIAPLYYAQVPDKPLEGYSTLARVYSQLFEKNVLRTFWANAVRRDSRQYIVKEGVFDEDSLAKITAGVDGAIIPVDTESISGIIQAVPVSPLSSNHDRYLNYIENDINRGSILAPFAKGEATRATATEITALAQYSASEIGRMARERDEVIERIANIYTRMLSILVEENEKPVVVVGGKPQFLTTDILDNPFRFAALDQANTPLSEVIKSQRLIELVPLLTQLGVQPATIRDEIVRAFDLPEGFKSDNDPEPQPEAKVRSAPSDLPSGPSGQAPSEQLAQELVAGARSIPLATA